MSTLAGSMKASAAANLPPLFVLPTNLVEKRTDFTIQRTEKNPTIIRTEMYCR